MTTMTKMGAVLLLAGSLLSACTMNQAERRAMGGGAIGAGAGAAGGYLLGYDPITSGLVGGAGGALLGAVTTPSREVHHHHHDRHDGRKGKRHRRHH